MPQSPLELLRNFALKNVPKPTVQQEENRDFRAQAIQDTEPVWKKAGRSALDAISGAFEDPMVDSPSVQKNLTKRSPGTAIGMLTAAAPGLPKISPRAYQDVKAGGFRLYSRLTNAFENAPKIMNPDKIRIGGSRR